MQNWHTYENYYIIIPLNWYPDVQEHNKYKKKSLSIKKSSLHFLLGTNSMGGSGLL